jgi:predicted O-methyltransferase YrrM
MSSLLRQTRYAVGTERELRRTSRFLRHASARATTAAEVADAAFAATDGPFALAPNQKRSELIDFAALAKDAQPRAVLEIGTGAGGTLFMLAWASAPDARILSLDLRIHPKARRRLYRSFATQPQHLTAIEADSHRDATRAQVERFFDGRALDLLFIDGAHDYDSVRRDFELYAPLVRDGGIVAFHDIVDGPPEAVGGVPQLWREVRSTLDAPRELVESWEQGGFGIGVGRIRAS